MESDDDYATCVLRHRCGDEIADPVVSVETLKLVLEVVAALEARLAELAQMVEGDG